MTSKRRSIFEFVAIGRLTVIAQTDHRDLLRQARDTFLLRRLLDGRPRSDADVAALSAVL